MNTTWKTRTAWGIAAAALATIGWSATAQAAPPTPVPTPAATATADAALVKNLTSMREEEQLARDVYTSLAAKYSATAPFANIATSEQRHFDTVGLLLARYGITDPAAGRSAGSYADADLKSLYDSLLASGNESVAKAYEVGITIENKDIADLKAAIAETSQADVKAALTNLLNGSQNHLAAFTAAKDGKVLGARNGQGMQNGRSGARMNGTGRAASAGTGRGAGQATGRGVGQGAGQSGSATRPATCPVR